MTTDSARRYTMVDMQPESMGRGGWKRVPEITVAALDLVRRAAPRQFAWTLLFQVVTAAALGAQLLIGKALLQDLITISQRGGSLSGLVPEFVLLLAVGGISGVVGALIYHQQRLLTEFVGNYAIDRILDVSTTVDLASFEDPVFFDQLERARTSGRSRPIQMVQSVTAVSTGFTTSLGVGLALAALEPVLLPLVVLAGVPVMLATLANSRQSYAFEYQLTPQSRERYYLMELLSGREPAKELRIFGATLFLRRRYDALTAERVREVRKFLRKRLRISLLGTSGTSLGMAIALGSLGYLLGTNRISVATAAAAAVAMQILASRISLLTSNLGRLVESGMFLDDFRIFLALGEERRRELAWDEAAGPLPPPQSPDEGLVVENVSFTYPQTTRRVLEDISLEVRPGEVVALVGENGSGKTTLVKLICHLYAPQEGRITWKGEDIDLAGDDVLREDMTVLFQDFIQYHLSAAENIELGRVERTPVRSEVEAASRRAGAHPYVQRLPEGYDTRLGRQFYGGHELSIGQWQRLALARAFYRDGEFLVLDEPTAALDPRAEHDLYEQMRELAKGRSVLLISHRFSSVRSADRIYVLHQGRLIESGSHDELLRQNGHYAELFNLQAQAYLGETPNDSLSS